jgi:hypothetical protein
MERRSQSNQNHTTVWRTSSGQLGKQSTPSGSEMPPTPCPATPNIVIGDLLEANSCMDEEGYGLDAVSTQSRLIMK